jgi:hypothetical protein
LRADMTENEFIKEVTDGLLPPQLILEWMCMNKQGYESFETVFKQRNESCWWTLKLSLKNGR